MYHARTIPELSLADVFFSCVDMYHNHTRSDMKLAGMGGGKSAVVMILRSL